jgi:hypothetical protein
MLEAYFHPRWKAIRKSLCLPYNGPNARGRTTNAATMARTQVPAGVELGFHICSIWHHYQAGGQDNTVLVDAVNALASRVTRPIAYVHIPTIPEHDEADFAPLAQLELGPETKLFLGCHSR